MVHPASQKIIDSKPKNIIVTDLSKLNYKNIKLYGFLNLYYGKLFLKSNL